MKNILFLITLISFFGCKKEVSTFSIFQNNLKKFIYLKVEIEGKKLDKNLVVYNKSPYIFNYTRHNNLIFRQYDYWGLKQQIHPYDSTYFDTLNSITIIFETNTTDNLKNRANKTFKISTNLGTDNRFRMSALYKNIYLTYENNPTDSVQYILFKDTMMDNKPYEISHLFFKTLTMVDDINKKIVFKNLELRQILYKNE